MPKCRPDESCYEYDTSGTAGRCYFPWETEKPVADGKDPNYNPCMFPDEEAPCPGRCGRCEDADEVVNEMVAAGAFSR